MQTISLNSQLPIHEACEDVIRSDSFGLSSLLKPINDGITIDGNPSKKPLFKKTKFLAIAAIV